MKYLHMRLVVCLALVTVATAFMLVGIRWLTFVGLACVVLSRFFSKRQVRNPGRQYIALFLCMVGFVLGLVWDWQDGDIFERKPLDIWWWFIFIGAWLWVVIDELKRWWSSRSITNAANTALEPTPTAP
jgi:hypothetical protein